MNETECVIEWLQGIGGDYLRVVSQGSSDAVELAVFLRCQVLGRSELCSALLLAAVNGIDWVSIADRVIKGDIR